MTALLERESSGIRVEVCGDRWQGFTLVVSVGERQEMEIIPAYELVLDAFHHPMVYLSDEQVAALFPKQVEEV